MAESQGAYEYTTQNLEQISATLSRPRIGTYMKEAKNDSVKAMRLYLWNARLSKALRFPLEVAEVALRNRIHLCLIDRYGANWLDDPRFLGHAAQKSVDKINDARTVLGGRATTDRIVAELSFGFWTAMLKDRFVEQLWRGRVTMGFPNLPKSVLALPFEDQCTYIKDLADQIRNLRNRISHLEPILKIDLSKQHSDTVHLVRLGCRTTSEWVSHHSTLPRVLREGPTVRNDDVSALARGWREYSRLDENATITQALEALKESERPFVAVDTAQGVMLVTGDDITRWLQTSCDIELAELDRPLSEVLAFVLPPVFLSKKATREEAAQQLRQTATPGKPGRPRAAFITEHGKPSETPIAIVDSLDLL